MNKSVLAHCIHYKLLFLYSKLWVHFWSLKATMKMCDTYHYCFKNLILNKSGSTSSSCFVIFCLPMCHDSWIHFLALFLLKRNTKTLPKRGLWTIKIMRLIFYFLFLHCISFFIIYNISSQLKPYFSIKQHEVLV